MDYAIYLIYRIFCALVGLFPLSMGFRLGSFFGLLTYYVVGPYRRLVTENMQVAFGEEKSEAEIRELARQHFIHLGANLFSSIKVASMSSEEVQACATTENFDILKRELARGKGAIMVISHIGNWEMFAQLAGYLPGVSGGTIYQAIGNPYIDAHLKSFRGRFGVRPFDRKDGFNAPMTFLREGGLLGILVDQHAGDGGIWIPLFGRLSSTSPLAAMLASRTGASLVPVAIYTQGVARWRMVVSEPLQPKPHASLEEVTGLINQALEKQIRVNPPDWFWVHNRWKLPFPRILVASSKRGIALPEEFDPKSLKPFRILIRSSNWLGDAVMTAPAVEAIKQGRPDAHITILTKAKLADFWKNVPAVDAVLPIEPADTVSSVAKKIRKAALPARFEVAVLFPNSIRVALEAWLAGVPRRVGYRRRLRSAFINQFVPESKNKKTLARQALRHQVHHYLGIAKAIGFEGKEPPLPAVLPQAGGPLKLGLCPGAEYGGAKRWLPERYAEAAQRIAAQTGCEWLLFGMPADAQVGTQISQAVGSSCRNLIGKTSLAQLIEHLRECSVLLTNDTGTMHLAAYLGVPTVAIFGSTEPMLTGPLGSQHTVVRHHVECSPCFLRECPLDFRCMKQVTVEEVVHAVLSKIQTPAKAEAGVA